MKKKVYKKYINELMRSIDFYKIAWFECDDEIICDESLVKRQRFINGKRMSHILFSHNGEIYKEIEEGLIKDSYWQYGTPPKFKPYKKYGLVCSRCTTEDDPYADSVLVVRSQCNGAYR